MNRDTLYSFATVDISSGATVTVPDAGDRYLSVMVVNQDHYINRILHQPGTYGLTVEEFDTPYVPLAARVLVNADDPDDLAAVHTIQDGLGITASSAEPFVMPDYDEPSFTATREVLLKRALAELSSSRGLSALRTRSTRPPTSSATAVGWGGLPDTRPSTWSRIRTCRSARTRPSWPTYRWTPSGP